MTNIGPIYFDNNVWNSCVPVTTEDLHALNDGNSGAVAIKTVTLNPRKGNPNECKLYDDHSTNNISLHNNGIDAVLKQLQTVRWKKPLFISLHGNRDEMMEMIKRIRNVDLLTHVLIEWNLSCPNISYEKYTVDQLVNDMQAYRKIWNGPIGIKIGCTWTFKNSVVLYDHVDFITAINTVDGVGGRRIHKQAVHFVSILRSVTKTPIIGCGGAENKDDVQRFLDAGACAVEMGTAYLKYGCKVFDKDQDQCNLIKLLKKYKVFQEGDFKLKNGEQSSFYFDFRIVPSIPDLWEKIILQVLHRIREIDFDIVCGVPTGAVPLASIIAHRCRKPLIQHRKTVKDYGTSNSIEGVFEKNQKVLLIEDVITTGSSALVTAEALTKAGLIVNNLFCLMNRSNHFYLSGVYFQSLFRIGDITSNIPSFPITKITNIHVCKLRSIIREKKSKVCISIDFNDPDDILNMLDLVGPYICMVKLHYDLIYFNLDTSPSTFSKKLATLVKKHNIMVFADRKIVDIPAIAKRQIHSLYNIYPPDFVTGFLHCNDMSGYSESNVFLVASMSSSDFGNTDPLYVQRVMNSTNSKNVAGFISQQKICDGVLHLVPGVSLNGGTDNMGQKYREPEDVKHFADVIIVGRGITKSFDPVVAVNQYRMRME